jgi:hypothetical protein
MTEQNLAEVAKRLSEAMKPQRWELRQWWRWHREARPAHIARNLRQVAR